MLNQSVRTWATAISVSALLVGTACDKPGVEAAQKESKAEQDNAAARDRAAHEVASAQVDTDKRVASAEEDLRRAREDFRHDRIQRLNDLDDKIAKMDADARTATGKAKAKLDANLPAIHAQRAAFASDLNSIDATTASTWDDTKARLDREWDGLKGAVDKAE